MLATHITRSMVDVAGSDDPSGDGAAEVLGNGRYAVTGILGAGSQGQTLEAVDKRDGRLVAIKRFTIRGADSWKDVELAEREARVLSRLDHPALPRYIEHFEEGGALYLVMEKVEGQTVRDLSRTRSLNQHAVVRLLNDMADVLDYLHQCSPPIIHRDIKPSNILLRPNGAFALVDFGSVRDCLRPEGGSTVVGTFGYMAPEQFQGRALPATDVYGLGATALTVLTGTEPDQLPHHGLAIDVSRALHGQVDGRLTRVLQAMLLPDPDARAPRLAPLLSAHRLRMSARDREVPAAFSPKAEAVSSAPSPSGAKGRHRARVGRRARWEAPAFDAWIFQNSFVVPLLLLGLEIAKLATWALFGVLLPVLFGVLSIFGGRAMRRAAVRTDYIGQRGRVVLTRLAERLSERADDEAARRHQQRQARRMRVPTRTRQRVPDSAVPDEQETLSDEASPQNPRATRR